MTLTSIFSILLILTTLTSYIPQYHCLLTLRSSAGLSVTGTLLNTLVAQVQVANMYYLFKSAPLMEHGVPIATPPSVRDWLNLTQILVQWVCSLFLLALVISLPASSRSLPTHPPASFGHDFTSKKVAASLWIVHLLSFIFFAAVGGRPQDTILNIIRNINAAIVNPIFTLLAVVAFFFQASVTWPARDLGVLSKPTLVLQFATFLLLAVSWPFRLILPSNMWRLGSKPAVLMEWYPWVGWACVNNAVMAIGQGAMLFTVSRGVDGKTRLAGEAQSLLRS